MKPSYMNLFVIDNGDIVQMDDIIAAMSNDRATVTTDVYIRNTVASIYTSGDSSSVSYYHLDIMADGMLVKSVRLDGGETQFDLAKVGPELSMRYYDITATAYSKYGRVMGTGRPAPWFNGTSLPKCEPMTLRFRFSKSDYVPSTAKGTWTKVEPCAENIWDWTCEDTSWTDAFKGVFIDSSNLVDVIDAGDTSSLTKCSMLFYSGSSSSSAVTYLSNMCWIDTKNVTTVSAMFRGCKYLNYIPYFNLEKVTNMSQIFMFCSKITHIPPFDTKNVTIIESAFAFCESLSEVPELNTKNVKSMKQLFFNCASLIKAPAINTSNVTNMQSMFAECKNIKEIPMLDTSKVTNMYQMFIKCRQLEHVPDFNTSNVTNMTEMFGASGIVDIPKWDTKSVTTFNGMFIQCFQLKSVPSLDTSNAVDMSVMFQHCHNLEFVGSFDASSATTIERMYFCCEKLKRVNYMPVKDNCNMSRVFDTYVDNEQRQYASSLEEMPNWDFSKASSLERAFRGCTSLKDIPDLGVPVNATKCSEMFKGCTNIETGMARAYSNLSAGSKMDKHVDVFTDCGTATAGGMTDRASIPVSWGGDMVE